MIQFRRFLLLLLECLSRFTSPMLPSPTSFSSLTKGSAQIKLDLGQMIARS